MQDGEIAYLALAIGAGVIFAIVIAWASHRTSKRD